MKNQYFGDVNDYRKYGLLRALQAGSELRLLVAWLLTPDDGGPDGKKRAYLEEQNRWRQYDPELYSGLVDLVGGGAEPRVSLIEESGLIPRTTFLSTEVPDDREARANWRHELSNEAGTADLVFFDPDNGIEVKSKPIGTKDSNKYLAWEEIDLVWDLGCSVLIYQHFPRVKRHAFIPGLVSRLEDRTGSGLVQAFTAGNVLFLLAAQKQHEGALRRGVRRVAERWKREIDVVPSTDSAEPSIHLGLIDLLGLAGFNPDPEDRLVRHQHQQYPVDQLISTNLLEVYQAYQARPLFHKSKHVVVLTGEAGTQARFYGVYEVAGWRGATSKEPITDSDWEEEWREQCEFFYELNRLPGFGHLEGRVVVDWGRGALAWCQKVRNKSVLEVKRPGRILPPFSDYLEFSISYQELQALFDDEAAHPEWRSQLSAVAGVYLILAETTGELYVGSAVGTEGIWGRWRDYARNGHGGNKSLKGLVESDDYPKAFRFSILQIVPKSMSQEDVIQCETSFKAKLGSRAHGLNLN